MHGVHLAAVQSRCGQFVSPHSLEIRPAHPWVISGGIVGGVSLALVGFLDNVWLIGISYCVCMIGLNMMIAPVIATLSDRVPANMRGTMSAFLAGGTAVGSALGQMLGSRFLSNQIPGFLLSGTLMGLAGICTVLVWPKEPSSKHLAKTSNGFGDMLKSFIPPPKAPVISGWRSWGVPVHLRVLHDTQLPTVCA